MTLYVDSIGLNKRKSKLSYVLKMEENIKLQDSV